VINRQAPLPLGGPALFPTTAGIVRAGQLASFVPPPSGVRRAADAAPESVAMIGAAALRRCLQTNGSSGWETAQGTGAAGCACGGAIALPLVRQLPRSRRRPPFQPTLPSALAAPV